MLYETAGRHPTGQRRGLCLRCRVFGMAELLMLRPMEILQAMGAISAMYVAGINDKGTTTATYPDIRNMVNDMLSKIPIPFNIMKLKREIISLLILSFFMSCKGIGGIEGTFVKNYEKLSGGMEFRIAKEPRKFEYKRRNEMGLLAYSKGNWVRDGNKLIMFGYNDQNIRLIDVESKLTDMPNSNLDEIIVQYESDPLDTFVKVDLIINDVTKVRILADTTLVTGARVKNLQVKSYLVHNGLLLGTSPTIDTLYSDKINIDNTSDISKGVMLKFAVQQDAFYRIKLVDTMTIKNRNTLIWQNKKFNKQ